MITIKQVYDAYPGRDDLGITVTEETTLADVELRTTWAQLGDTLFLFLCRELCDPDEQEATDLQTLDRITTVVNELTALHTNLLRTFSRPPTSS